MRYLVTSNDKNLNLTLWTDVPRSNGAGDTDDQRAEDRGAKSGYREIVQYGRHEPKHACIEYQQEQAERDYGQRQRHQECNWPHETVHEPQQQCCEYECPGTDDLYAGNQS